MIIEQFIKKAVEGEWYKDELEDTKYYIKGYSLSYIGNMGHWQHISIYEILLDPLAWQAVGKVEKWGVWITDDETGESIDTWKYNFYQLPVALADGKSLEDYLKTL